MGSYIICSIPNPTPRGGGGLGWRWKCLVQCGRLLAIGGNAVHRRGRLFYYYCTQTEKKVFQVAYSAVVQSENVFSMGTTNLSFTSESCACSSVAFLAGATHYRSYSFANLYLAQRFTLFPAHILLSHFDSAGLKLASSWTTALPINCMWWPKQCCFPHSL